MSTIPTIVLPRDGNHEFVRVMTRASVEKRTEEFDHFLAALARKGLGVVEARARAERQIRPYEIVEGDYNAMVDGGIDRLLLLLVGGGGTAYNNANAFLGVGDSATAWATTQTDLQAATNKLRTGMVATYPVTGTKKQTFRSDFTTGQANWVWNEWCIANAVSGATSLLSRKVESLGTKASGTWTLTVEFSLT
jgi:hypothetical protein